MPATSETRSTAYRLLQRIFDEGFAAGAARTHAAERCANAAVHTFSCAPNLSDPKGGQMTTTSTGLATTVYQGLAAAPRAEVIAPGDAGFAEASWSLGERC